MIDIGNDAFADIAADRRNQGHAAGGHVNNLTGKFAAIGQHVAAEQIDAHTLEAALLLVQRKHVKYFLQHGHAA